jgi:magnesium chelatase family protein
VVIARSQATVRFPARFQLITAANPCPCGHFVGRGDRCTCAPLARRRYASRVSGPIRDRIDIHRALVQPTRAELRADLGAAESTARVRPRVTAARERQITRFAGTPWRCNGHVPGPELRRSWPASPDAMAALSDQLASGVLTARGADRVLRVAWTLADLAEVDRPGVAQVQTAGELRGTSAPRA